MLLIKNGYILDPESGYEGDADILVENGRIKKLYKGFTGMVDESLFENLEVIDADGWGEFRVDGGSVSTWVMKEAYDYLETEVV